LTYYIWNFKLFSKPWHRQLQKAQTNFNLQWRAVTFELKVLERSCLQFQKAEEFRTFTMMALAFVLYLCHRALIFALMSFTPVSFSNKSILHHWHCTIVILNNPKNRKNCSSSAKRHKMALSRASLFYTIIWENGIINLFRPS